MPIMTDAELRAIAGLPTAQLLAAALEAVNRVPVESVPRVAFSLIAAMPNGGGRARRVAQAALERLSQ